MKLRQKEYCHNCDQHVIFEFEDVNGRQVIDCPVCGHKHYRELDDVTILDIRMDMTNRRGPMYIAEFNPIAPAFLTDENEPIADTYLDVKRREVLGTDAEGRVMVKPEDGEKGNGKVVTERRWGVDPRQGRA